MLNIVLSPRATVKRQNPLTRWSLPLGAISLQRLMKMDAMGPTLSRDGYGVNLINQSPRNGSFAGAFRLPFPCMRNKDVIVTLWASFIPKQIRLCVE